MVLLGEEIASYIASGNDSRDNTIVFSWESGYIIPMYAVATNCRDHTIRQRAIAVVHSVPRQEDLWNGLPVADAAGMVTEIDERELRRANARADGHEALEWFSSRPLLKINGRGARLHYTRNTQGENVPQEVVEEVYSW
ncbi:hypothetical protein F5B21DRAFT_495299 [Xylaria acuta]|nr:hypothetical protein F5B21DRAFT_495299 [Xylaria acuta]